ncbi:hypothetical protein GALL_78790 [mine drainage metagenome]|uniref:Uncharacterized protein n=1 Tax=mine drainage metagenome TaxID=410659 RepID=A0A1J5T130_9ZZZZ
MDIYVLWAVYGALKSGQAQQAQAADVTACLQTLLKAGSVAAINNGTMGGDPCFGFTKAFGACVVRQDQKYLYACQEGQQVDFSTGGFAAGAAPKAAAGGALAGLAQMAENVAGTCAEQVTAQR